MVWFLRIHQNLAQNLNLNGQSCQLQTGTFLVSYHSFIHVHLRSLACGKFPSSPRYRLAVGASVTLRPFPAMGRSLSSHSVTPSQAQICLGFWNKPAERAMIPHASLRQERERKGTLSKHTHGPLKHIKQQWVGSDVIPRRLNDFKYLSLFVLYTQTLYKKKAIFVINVIMFLSG